MGYSNLLLMVTIVILLFLSPSCKDDSVSPQENHPPEIRRITSNPSTSSTNRLPGGDTVRLIVVASDPDNDKLSYTWSAYYGRFIGGVNETSVQWEAPIRVTEEDYAIEVIVSDGGYIAEGAIIIYVDKSLSPTDTVTDIDGNVYQTVKIGEQWWMAENLRVTRYRNGDAIPTNLSDDEWHSTRYAAYAIYPHGIVDGINSEAEMVAAYGKLYNWYAVDDSRGLCPPGWHVPSDTDWMTLTNYLDDWSRPGGKMKSTRTEPDAHPRWRIPNTGATNESGFSGLPAGLRNYYGSYLSIGNYGTWWSSEAYTGDDVWFRYLSYNISYMLTGYFDKRIGRSVRCLRD